MDQWHSFEHKIIANVSSVLKKNVEVIEQLFADCDDVIKKELQNGQNKQERVYICYIDGLINREMLEESIVRPFLNRVSKGDDWFSDFFSAVSYTHLTLPTILLV